jgi:hypothetical protein
MDFAKLAIAAVNGCRLAFGTFGGLANFSACTVRFPAPEGSDRRTHIQVEERHRLIG